MTTATKASWPTARELAGVMRDIGEATQAIENLDLDTYARIDDVPPSELPQMPTPEEFSALTCFIEVAAQEIDSMGSYLEGIREAHRETALHLSIALAKEAYDAS